MPYVGAYGKDHIPIPSDAISGGVKPIPSTSSKNHFYNLVTQSTFFTIVFNVLKPIIITELQFI